ncbi:DNA ligase 1 isoform X2 [Perca flavescens]|nr:DNA ligase 1-like isoform X2 [Perca flavescens]XP_028432910.1 DNA ligase 1-like isoform X2 [Perca flavescens]XP_028432911.1 DNA ligase 1-like isoform X2 [Perca flavescens]
MFRSIFQQKVFTRPRSSGGMDSSSKKSKQRSERPSSPEDLNPPTIWRKHGRRGERPSSSGDTNPSNIVKEHRERGEGPLSCAEHKPSTTRQQAWRGESPSSSSSEDDQRCTTRLRVRRFERPSSSSSEDKQPTTRRRQQAWRGESPSSSSSEDDQRCTTRLLVQRDVSSLFIVGPNPSNITKEHRQRGESPLSCAENQPPTTRQQERRFESPSSSSSKDDQRSTTRQQEQKDVSSLFFVGTNMKERRRKGESPLSCAENTPSTTSARKEREITEREKQRLEEEGLKRERERCEKMKRKNQEKERKTFGLRSRTYIWWLNCKIDNIARDIQSTFVDERYLLRHDPLRNPEKMAEKERLLDLRRELVLYKRRQEFKVEREVRKQRLKAMERRRKAASPLSCAENTPSTTRQQEQRAESPSSSSSEDSQPSTPSWQQARRGESPSSSSSEDDEPSTTRRQQQESPLSFVDINLPTTFRQNGGIGENHLPCVDIDQPIIWWEHVRRGERPLFRGDLNPSDTLRQDGRSGDSPSSTSSSSEDDEPSTTRRQQERRANSPLSINLSARKEWEFIEREKQHLEEEGLKRERERCEKMKRKNQEKERKMFSPRSRMHIWWLNRKIDNIARDIQSTFVDERYLLRHDPLRNPEKMAEKERLLDRRRELVLYKRRQEFKVEREVRKQRLKVERKEINAKKMENISELYRNSEYPAMLNFLYGPMPIRSHIYIN